MSMKKLFLATAFAGSLASTAAFAQNNNTGEIYIQGVVPGVWEITVQDINSGYDFDLSDTTITSARVGTVHIYTNDDINIGAQLFIESLNAGRMINNSTIPNIAGDNQKYWMTLAANTISANDLTTTYEGAAGLPTDHDLIVPALVDIASEGGANAVGEGTFDVTISLVDPSTTNDERAEASGVYTDTIIFTIMDDG